MAIGRRAALPWPIRRDNAKRIANSRGERLEITPVMARRMKTKDRPTAPDGSDSYGRSGGLNLNV